MKIYNIEGTEEIKILYSGVEESDKFNNEYYYFVNPPSREFSSINYYYDESYNKKLIRNLTNFKNLLKNKSYLFKEFDDLFINTQTTKIVRNLLTIHAEKINIDITEDKSVFFTAIINDFNIYIELFFDIEEPTGMEVVLNIYKNKKNIYAYGGQIEDCFIKINEKTKTTSIFNSQNEYGLSGTFATATSLEEYSMA